MTIATSSSEIRDISGIADQSRMLGLLQTILVEQTRGYKKLEASLIQKKAALANADVAGITDRCRNESTLLARLAELERDRRTVVAKLTEAIDPSRAGAFTMSELTQQLNDESKSQLLTIAADLKKHVHAVQHLNDIIRSASNELTQQMNEVMQKVQESLCKTAIYQKRGGLAKATNTSTAVDIQS